MRTDVINTNQMGVQMGGPQMQQTGIIKQQFIPRAGGQQAQPWVNQVANNSQQFSGNQITNTGTTMQQPEPVKTIPLYNANLQPPPPVPPENIVTEQDRQSQIIYEQWLNQQNNSLKNQQQYYETEILKIRKVKKSLNTKQRQLKKAGNELSNADAQELAKVNFLLCFCCIIF